MTIVNARISGTIPRVVAVLLLLGLSGCGPSYDEASEELERLLDPALKAGFRQVDMGSFRQDRRQHCSDPIFGPKEGLRPAVFYDVPLSRIEDEGESLLSSVEKAWKDLGLEVEAYEGEGTMTRRASTGPYGLRALVNLNNGEASIGGSGPCVDDPNT